MHLEIKMVVSIRLTIPGLIGLNWRYYFYTNKDENIYLSGAFNHSVLLFLSNSTNFTMLAIMDNLFFEEKENDETEIYLYKNLYPVGHSYRICRTNALIAIDMKQDENSDRAL